MASESARATPLGAEVSTGTKPQITYFLQPPTLDTLVHTDRCRPVRKHTHP